MIAGKVPTENLSFGNLKRIESKIELPAGRGKLAGVMQHVLYTDAAARRDLAAVSAGESGPSAVLIPIAKSSAWWAMAQDERSRCFHGASQAKGHYAIGAAYAGQIFRRLYHARYLPGAEWDFLTYFEFPRERAGLFRQLLSELRDPELNPEWSFVERELEIWLLKRG